jgi:hypothetical protein
LEPLSLATIQGFLFQQRADGTERGPMGGVAVALYCEPFLPGTLPANPPLPVAVAVTGSDGSFGFPGVPAGSWFVTTVLAPVFTRGVALEVEPGQTVTVELIGCLDCPPPA